MMRSNRSLSLALAGATFFFAAACSSGDAGEMSAEDEMAAESSESEMGEMSEMDESGEMGEMSEMGEMACFTRGDTEGRPSPLHTVEFTVSGDQALLCYGAPSARDRQVFGDLVPFGEPWRMGANEATALHLSFPAMIGDVEVEPGGYSLYATPGEDEWTIHVNSSMERWGIPINQDVMAADIATFTVPSSSLDDMVETMNFSFESHEDGMGHLVFEWEHTQVEIPVHHNGMM